MIRNLLNNSLNICAVLAFATLFASANGCKKNETAPAPAPQQAPAAVPKAAVQKPVSSAAIKLTPAPSGNQFDFSNKKDPFKPFIVAKKGPSLTEEQQKKALRDALPIHSFDVSQFKLIGIVTGSKENQAMAVDPNGKGYVLKVGMSIGKNDGRIVSISPNGVEVIEQFRDDSGRVRKENIRLTLPRKQ